MSTEEEIVVTDEVRNSLQRWLGIPVTPRIAKPAIDELYQDWNAVVTALSSDDHFAAAILVVAFIEKGLGAVLRQHFIKNSDTVKRVVDGASLRDRTNLCYCLGFVSTGMKKAIDWLGEIRNEFAHNHTKITFDDEKIAKLVGCLKYPRRFRSETEPSGFCDYPSSFDPFAVGDSAVARFVRVAYFVIEDLEVISRSVTETTHTSSDIFG